MPNMLFVPFFFSIPYLLTVITAAKIEYHSALTFISVVSLICYARDQIVLRRNIQLVITSYSYLLRTSSYLRANNGIYVIYLLTEAILVLIIRLQIMMQLSFKNSDITGNSLLHFYPQVTWQNFARCGS